MVRLAANISMMFQEVDLLERFAQAAEVGFGAVEIHAPYDEAKEAVAAAAKRNGVEVVLLNVMPPVAAIPGREGEFREAAGSCTAWPAPPTTPTPSLPSLPISSGRRSRRGPAGCDSSSSP
jgi:hydroxypyruvate isomerase